MRCWVPSLHILGHNEDCQIRYSLAYAEGVGRTHGEGIETCWAEQNQTGGMTKEMNAGHRHDTLNDFSGDWNWQKTQQMSECRIFHNWETLPVLFRCRQHTVSFTGEGPRIFSKRSRTFPGAQSKH